MRRECRQNALTPQRSFTSTRDRGRCNSIQLWIALHSMPRGPRLDAPGVLHHIMARAIERQLLFRDDHDREDFVHRVAAWAEAEGLFVYAWTLLPNHFHLLVRTGSRPLARSMRSLLTGYAGAFNRRHHRRGHLLQTHYKSIVCEEEPWRKENSERR